MRYGNHLTAEAFNWNLHGRPISLASISLDILENECFDETEIFKKKKKQGIYIDATNPTTAAHSIANLK